MVTSAHMQILRDYMAKKGWNQSQLADFLGTDRFVVSKWINGKKRPRLESLQNIAYCTDIDLRKLVESLNGSANAKRARNGKS
jgi:transcriptional regulator with XRE-family HTH domain